MRWPWCFGLCFLGTVALGQQKNFISCPIVRDTKTAPCFLAEYDGELYYLGIQQDAGSEFHPPQLKHQVLVEGSVVTGPRVCGGIPLQPVSISVLKEVNLACNTLLPPEPGFDAPVVPRASEPSSASLTGKQEFKILYAFDDDFLDYAGNQMVTEAAAYAKRMVSSNVKVSGYRATTILSNGEKLTEKTGIAEKRTQNIATILRGLGVSGVTAESKAEPEPGDGKTDPSRRRVTILVTP
jgi:outer membrane protein OmpA-like peptidoglycan-associated protein